MKKVGEALGVAKYKLKVGKRSNTSNGGLNKWLLVDCFLADYNMNVCNVLLLHRKFIFFSSFLIFFK